MGSTTLNQVHSKLKELPETLLAEVEKYIDFLNFKYSQDIPGWQKDILDERLRDLENPNKIKSVESLFNILDQES